MFKIRHIAQRGDSRFQVVVDLSETDSWYKRRGKPVPVDNLVLDVFFHNYSSQWRSKVPLVWRVVNDKLGCVQAKMPARQEKIAELQSILNKYEGKNTINEEYMKKKQEFLGLVYNWNPCLECKHSTTCDKKYLTKTVYPKVHVDGRPSTKTWIIAMNAGSAIAKMINPRYPANTKTQSSLWDGIRKCSDCALCSPIRRDNDPDCIDAIQGVVTFDESQYDKVERAFSTMDQRHLRDTRAPVSYMRCSMSGNLVFDEDACSDYIWNALLKRYCDWVPASPTASVTNGEITGGFGEYAVKIPKEVLQNVQIHQDSRW